MKTYYKYDSLPTTIKYMVDILCEKCEYNKKVEIIEMIVTILLPVNNAIVSEIVEQGNKIYAVCHISKDFKCPIDERNKKIDYILK